MKNFFLLFLAIFMGANTVVAQRPLDKYWVQFTDKNKTPYSLNQPQKFLSSRAIERRQRQGIAIDISDLPVDPNYVQIIKNEGAIVFTVSKWFNGVTIQADSAIMSRITALPFVVKAEPTGRASRKRKARKNRNRDRIDNYPKTDSYYGYGDNQIRMLNGQTIHDMGYRGEGMLIAVMDGGFRNVDIMPFFDSLRVNGRMMESRDIVDNDNFAYESSSHGSQVMSTMASNLPGLLVGTAPDATYICIKTEDTGSEMLIEEDNWVVGAEYADSLGVDVINSSLGYTTFDEKFMDHTYESLDGKSNRASLGADIAASKGMLVVNSAGNSGGSAWKYIGAPADAYNILTVGAVNRKRKRSYFSSYGPTSDGRRKPNVSARGTQTVVASLFSYKVDSANGTSFSSPVMAGMATSLWQAFPEKTNMEIITALEESGDQYDSPDNALGFGIPNFYKAYRILSGEYNIDVQSNENINANSNLIHDRLELSFEGVSEKDIHIEVYNLLGQQVFKQKQKQKPDIYNRYKIKGVSNWANGVYRVYIRTGDKTYRVKILKI